MRHPRIKTIPAGIDLFKVNYGLTKTTCEIYSKIPIKKPEQRQR